MCRTDAPRAPMWVPSLPVPPHLVPCNATAHPLAPPSPRQNESHLRGAAPALAALGLPGRSDGGLRRDPAGPQPPCILRRRRGEEGDVRLHQLQPLVGLRAESGHLGHQLEQAQVHLDWGGGEGGFVRNALDGGGEMGRGRQ